MGLLAHSMPLIEFPSGEAQGPFVFALLFALAESRSHRICCVVPPAADYSIPRLQAW